ncbi:MAG: CCA tRNA nucleotidyltransferase [Pseudomonadota bacterium]
MRITGDWITADHVQAVLAAIERGGHRALLVGGCVRNDLLGLPVTDIDIATDALPARVAELASGAGLRCVPTGIDHGTVTVIAEGRPHEVTTFRRDVETDGRRAVVAFSERLEDDASRRDFTMNALYADRDGAVLDPVGGIGDLRARRVRFVGDPAERIREDYLRILRFFRFHAAYGDVSAGLDAEALAACAGLAAGIDGLSRERVGQEMRKLLSACDPSPSVAAMQAAGVLTRVLPGAEAAALPVLVHLERDLPVRWLRRLAVLGGGPDVAGRLRLSRGETRALARIRAGAASAAGPAALGYEHGARDGADAVLVRAALSLSAGAGAALPEGWGGEVARGAAQTLPVRAADLAPLAGAALGARLKEIEARWIASGFSLSRRQLLS